MHSALFLLLIKKTSQCYNRAIIVVAVLYMLYYTCNNQSNLFHAVTGYLSFAHNVFKQYVEVFYLLSIIILYNFIRQSLNSNALIVKNILLNKVLEKRFFISYNNINFYKNTKD